MYIVTGSCNESCRLTLNPGESAPVSFRASCNKLLLDKEIILTVAWHLALRMVSKKLLFS